MSTKALDHLIEPDAHWCILVKSHLDFFKKLSYTMAKALRPLAHWCILDKSLKDLIQKLTHTMARGLRPEDEFDFTDLVMSTVALDHLKKTWHTLAYFA